MPSDRQRLLGYVETIQLIVGVTDKKFYGDTRLPISTCDYFIGDAPQNEVLISLL